MKQIITLRVNGETYEVGVKPWWTLLEVIEGKVVFDGDKERL